MSYAVICSGQGAQSPTLFDRIPFTEKGLAIRDAAVAGQALPPDAVRWLENPTGDPAAIYVNHLSQPLICLYHMMVWAELALPRPECFAGFSLGELSAYGCAGAITPVEIVRLATVRAEEMDAARPGRLVVQTGLSFESAGQSAQTFCGEAYIAIVLGDDHCVIGCETDKAPALAAHLLQQGATLAEPLAVSVPSHTRFLDSAASAFLDTLQGIAWRSPLAPVYSGTGAVKVFDRPQMEHALSENIHQTIRWDKVESRIVESGCKVILELGPGRQLSHALLAAYPGMESRSVDEFHTWEGVGEWVQKALARA